MTSESTFGPRLSALTFGHHVKSCKVFRCERLLRALRRCLNSATLRLPLHAFLLKEYIFNIKKDLKHNESRRGEQNACVFCMTDCISTAAVVPYVSAGSF